MSFRDNAFANPAGLVAYIAEQGSFAKVRPDMKVVFIRDVEDLDERLKTTAGILRSLVRIAERKQAALTTGLSWPGLSRPCRCLGWRFLRIGDRDKPGDNRGSAKPAMNISHGR